MLAYLKVLDFALIERIEVEFRDGLNVLTGETGTGKTVLVGAIGLLLGDRADTVQVRHGAEAATLECVFDLTGTPEARGELERQGFITGGEEELMLGRTVPAGGKSRCTVNGRICPVSTLGAIGDILLDVHGQNTHQALLKTSTHVEYLDRFAGREQIENLGKYRRSYGGLKSLLTERRQTGSAGEGLEREAELLRGEVERIRKAEPLPGELEKLETEAERFRHAKELWELSARVEAALVSDDRPAAAARDTLSFALVDMKRMLSIDREISGMADRLESIILDTDDLAADVSAYRERLEMEPTRLQEVESRISQLRDLCRRHGGSLESVISYADEAEWKLRGVEESIERAGALAGEIEEAREEVARLAELLTRGREGAASSLQEAVNTELGQLELESARFEVDVRVEEKRSARDRDGTGAFGPSGSSEVEFLFSPVREGPAMPLRRIASGGEMSRVMLALKIVLAGADRIPTLVFDEVDAGIGGKTAAKVGEKLHQLTRYHQVFCVTHNPRIATFADWHYQVFKSGDDGGAQTGINPLSDDDRVDEICRMLGDSTRRKVTREHAKDILTRADKAKGP